MITLFVPQWTLHVFPVVHAVILVIWWIWHLLPSYPTPQFRLQFTVIPGLNH